MPINNGKKTILLLSDDLRMNSGIATMSRELVLGTVHKYNWVQIAGAINHPDKGKVFDLSQATNQMKKMENAYVKLYPTDGYGNEQMLFTVMAQEGVNAIMHFTDPRFWGWLYALEKQIRSKMPLTYLTIWDDIPYPMYNKAFYESCDGLFAISKQTLNINRHVLGEDKTYTLDDVNSVPKEDIKSTIHDKSLLHYVPHGINAEVFKPLDDNDPKLLEFKKKLFSGKDYKYVILYNSRNVQRKRTSNVMMAYRMFCDNLPKEEAEKCVLVLHTEITCDAGTNLLALKEAFCQDNNVIFSPGKLTPEDMCLLYNSATMTVNASSNEGFGLSIAESIMCGTPVTATVTGGLQDQIGQTDDDGNPIVFDKNFGTNSIGKYKKHGEWAYPVWPIARLVQGSIPTPYIFDDITKWEDIAEGFMYWYLMPDESRIKRGQAGRDWSLGVGGLNSDNMSSQYITCMEFLFENWTPPKKFNVYSVKDYMGNHMPDKAMGFEMPTIDIEKIKTKLKQ
jgi:glycosyltransferase involved in cell wall biosynthesis